MIPKIYTILTYFLFLPAALLGFTVLFSLLLAFANPGALLITFILISVIIYTIVSYNFLQKVVINNMIVKNKLKDWLKVNAYVTIFFASTLFLNIIQVFAKPQKTKMLINEIIEQQKNNSNVFVNESIFYKTVMVVFILFFIYALLLIIHLICSFILLKKHHNNFVEDV